MNDRSATIIADLLHREPPKAVRRFLTLVGRGMTDHAMVADGERILLSISGGKDSLALAAALRLRQRFVPVAYSLEATLVNWREHPHSAEALDRLRRWFDALEVPLRIIDADMRPTSFGDRFDCYRCGRNRRRILFDTIRHDGAPSVIATGHHLDDIVQTTLMNMMMRGEFATMRPVQPFFEGEVRVIRPLCLVPEAVVVTVASMLELPVSTIDCPFRTTNIRARIAPIIDQMAAINPGAREAMFRSLSNVRHDYLPD